MKKKRGIVVLFALIFGSIFLVSLIGILSLILFQMKLIKEREAWENSLHIAEAGINYYWYLLNHTPSGQNPEIQDGKDWCCKVGGIEYASSSPQCQQNGFIVCGTCDGEPCYEHSYIDPETNQEIGKFLLKIKAKKICGRILGVYVTSVGFTKKYPNLKRKLEAKFAATSIAEYSYISNVGVWYGPDEVIYGKIHSNQGIRMDGTHNSIVSSAVSNWTCTWSYGCSAGSCPSGCTPSGGNCLCNGVAGDGGPQDLWKFPVPSFDFAGLTHDLTQMKNLAQTCGLYYPPPTDIDSLAKGYHITFNQDGSFDIKVITNLQSIYGYEPGVGWQWLPEKIISEYLPSAGVYGGYSLQFDDVVPPQGCGLIFLEGKTWVDGIVKGKKTLAVADLINPGEDLSVFLNWNIDYTTLDGSDSLAIITENNVYIPLYSPDNMVVRGVLVAQKGKLIRKYYPCGWYSPWCLRDDITFYGSVVSSERGVTTWVNWSGTVISGYKNTHNYFDSKLAKDPPPLLPYVSEAMEIISFQEIR